MMTLTLDLETSATILGAPLDRLREAIQRQEIVGIHIGGEWRISIFALAKLLDTSPKTLVDFLEDDALVRLIGETNDEALLDREEAQAIYQTLLQGTS